MFEEIRDRQRAYSPEVQSVANELPPGPCLSVKEIAAVLGYSSEYVRGLVDAGHVKATPALGQQRENIRIYRLSFLDYLERNLKK